VTIESFAAVAARPTAQLDELALALAGEFGDVDAAGALARLDRLAEEVAGVLGSGSRDPRGELDALREVIGRRHVFVGDREDYDHPDNSMLDRVLVRGRGLPIVLSIIYVEVARRAGIDLGGVGLPGHFVVGHFGQMPPMLIDPFAGGGALEVAQSADLARWAAHETVLRMLNNLVGSYQRRHDLMRAIRAAELRLALPLSERAAAALALELRQIRAALN
jgi:regulator of sirC expression with transglutaminase-like and TPR domain